MPPAPPRLCREDDRSILSLAKVVNVHCYSDRPLRYTLKDTTDPSQLKRKKVAKNLTLLNSVKRQILYGRFFKFSCSSQNVPTLLTYLYSLEVSP